MNTIISLLFLCSITLAFGITLGISLFFEHLIVWKKDREDVRERKV